MAKKIIIGTVAVSSLVATSTVLAVEVPKQNAVHHEAANLQNTFYRDAAAAVAQAPKSNNPFTPETINGVEDLSSDAAKNPLVNFVIDPASIKTFLIAYTKNNHASFDDYFWNVVTPIFNPQTSISETMAKQIADATKEIFITNPLIDPRLVLVNEIKKAFGPSFSPTFSQELESGAHKDLVDNLVKAINAHTKDDSFAKKMSTYQPFVNFNNAKATFPADVKNAIVSNFDAYTSLLDNWSTKTSDIETFYNNAKASGYVDQAAGDNFNNSFKLVFNKIIGKINLQNSTSTPNPVVTSFVSFIADKKATALAAATNDNVKAIIKTVLDGAEQTAINNFTNRFNTAMSSNNFDWLTNYANFLNFAKTPEYTAFDLAGTNALSNLKTKIDNLSKNLITTISYTDYNNLISKPLKLDDVLVKSAATTAALDDLIGPGKIFTDAKSLSDFLIPKIATNGVDFDHAYITYGVDRSIIQVDAGTSSSFVPHAKEIPISYSIHDYENIINTGDWSNQTIQDPTTFKQIDYKKLSTLVSEWTKPGTGFDAFNSAMTPSLDPHSLHYVNDVAKKKLQGLNISNVQLTKGVATSASATSTDVSVSMDVKDSTNQVAHIHFTLKNIPFNNPLITNALKTEAKNALTAANVYINGAALQAQTGAASLPVNTTYTLAASDTNIQGVIDKANAVFITNASQINFFNQFRSMSKNNGDVLTIAVELLATNNNHPDTATVTINANNNDEPLVPSPTPITIQMPVLWLNVEQTKANTNIDKSSSDFSHVIDNVQDGGYLSQESIDSLQKTLINMQQVAKTTVSAATDPTLPNMIATKFKNELDAKKPLIDFLDSKMGEELIEKIKKPDGSIDFNNPDLIKYQKMYDAIKNNPDYAAFWDQLKTMDLKDFESLNLKHIGSLASINGIVLKVMTGLGALMGITGIGLGSSVVATAVANRRLKNRKDNTIRFQGIKKLFSFQTVIALASAGASVALLVYVFVVKGGF